MRRLISLALLWGALGWGLLSQGFLENFWWNAAWRLRGVKTPGVKVAYVLIDDASVESLGGEPMGHRYLAQALERLLGEAQVSCVGVTYGLSDYRTSPLIDEADAIKDHEALTQALKWHKRVVLAVKHGKEGRLRGRLGGATLKKPPEPWGDLAFALGLVEKSLKKIEPIYYAPAFEPYALSLELLRCHLNGTRLRTESNAVVLEGAQGEPLLKAPLYQNAYLVPTWFHPFEDDNTFSIGLHALLAPEGGKLDDTTLEALRGAIVLIGQGPPLKRVQVTPLDPFGAPPVALQGALIQSLEGEACLRFIPRWLELCICIAFTGALVLCLARLKGLALAVSVLGIFGGYLGAAYALLIYACWVLPVVAPLAGGLAGLVSGFFLQLHAQEEEKQRIKTLFSAYVAKPFVEKLLRQPNALALTGERHTVTAFFTDLSAFSRVSEGLSPEQVVTLMNDYLGVMTRLLQSQGGTLDKYIGDAIVAFFGAPLPLEDHAVRACRVALLIQQEHEALLRRWATQGWPPSVQSLKTRISLHTGPVVVGNIGSSVRFNYTMMGDTVNVAARGIEACKQHQKPILVTQATFQAVRAHTDSFTFAPLGAVTLRGRKAAVTLYALIGWQEASGGKGRVP